MRKSILRAHKAMAKGMLTLMLALSPVSAYASGELEPKRLKSSLIDFGIGAASGAASMAVYTPFHYFQNRQIQRLPIAWDNPTYWFRGLPSLALGKAPTFAIQMSSYNLITTAMRKNNGIDLNSKQQISAAMIAGGLSGIANNATHLIALRQENSGSKFIPTVKDLVSSKTSMRGLGTTMSREMIFTNIYMNFLKKLQESIHKKTDNKPLAQVSSGLLSGGAIALTTQPFMVVTAKLYADVHKAHYQNGLDCAYKTYLEGGIKGFYKGTGYRSIGILFALPVLDYVEKMLSTRYK